MFQPLKRKVLTALASGLLLQNGPFCLYRENYSPLIFTSGRSNDYSHDRRADGVILLLLLFDIFSMDHP